MRTSPLIILSVAVALGVAACGGEDDGDVLPAAPTEATVPSDGEPDAQSDPQPVGDAAMLEIGRANVGGPVVDATLHPIDRIDIAESLPEQLAITFTSGDPSCTAADATASVTGDIVLVELFVGITEDALARSCRAGEFEQTITIPLDQPLDGREPIGAVPPEVDSSEPTAPLPGDGSVEAMADAIVGLDVDTAEQQVTDAGFSFRVVEVNGQPQVIIEDLRDDRINVRIEDGSVVEATVF